MKDNKFIYGFKTAGIAVTAMFTMASCGNKQLSETQTQIVKHKADSAAAVHHEYKMATGLIDLCEIRIGNFHQANKDLTKIYARDYILNSVQDNAVKNFMMKAIEDTTLIAVSVSGVEKFDGIPDGTLSTMRYIRHNQQWFNDLILFLGDNYNEQRLLDSEFFKVVDNPYLKTVFERNTRKIKDIQSGFDFAMERKTAIYNQLWNQYSKEVQKKR